LEFSILTKQTIGICHQLKLDPPTQSYIIGSFYCEVAGVTIFFIEEIVTVYSKIQKAEPQM